MDKEVQRGSRTYRLGAKSQTGSLDAMVESETCRPATETQRLDAVDSLSDRGSETLREKLEAI